MRFEKKIKALAALQQKAIKIEFSTNLVCWVQAKHVTDFGLCSSCIVSLLYMEPIYCAILIIIQVE